MKIRSDNIALESAERAYGGNLTGDDLIPVLNIDAHVSSATLDLKLVDELNVFEPFGAANPKPIFITKDLIVESDPTVMKEKHLKIYLRDRSGRRFEAVWWDGVRKISGRTLNRGKASNWLMFLRQRMAGKPAIALVVEDLEP
jgi:single-stranded DNA-specific DHH superfamily exonuclease